MREQQYKVIIAEMHPTFFGDSFLDTQHRRDRTLVWYSVF